MLKEKGPKLDSTRLFPETPVVTPVTFCIIPLLIPLKISIKQAVILKPEQEKQPLPSTLYTEEYFLTACEGYDEFTTTEGEQLSRRLSAAFKLAEITPGMTILDVGCGRGEILRHCA